MTAKECYHCKELVEENEPHDCWTTTEANLTKELSEDLMDAWERLRYASFWWLHLMIAVWAIFALMIYLLEPLLMHRLFRAYALQHKDRAFALAIRLHSVALLVSVLAIAAGVLGAHGGLP